MQEHKVGPPVWPYKYRILMRENSIEIANSNDFDEIIYDWKYLENNAVPQLDKKMKESNYCSSNQVWLFNLFRHKVRNFIFTVLPPFPSPPGKRMGHEQALRRSPCSKPGKTCWAVI